jgi:DNA-binding IclR family transcriptional regulator
MAKELGYPAAVTERVGDELVITTLDLGPCQAGDVAAGDRLPFAAPFGVVFAAWEDEEGRRAWMDRGAITNPVLAQRLDDLLTTTRARGYSVERMAPAVGQATRLMTTLRDDPQVQPMRRMVDGLLAEIASLGLRAGGDSDDNGAPITAVAAPVLDPHSRRVLASVGIHPLRPLSPERADTIGRRVIQAAATVNRAADGGPPLDL